MNRPIMAGMAILLMLLIGCGRNSRDGGGKEGAVITLTSNNDFFTTVTRLQSAIAANNLVLLKEYNIQAMMKMVDKNVESFMTFQTFHPRYGKVLIENDSDAFVSTPLSFLVRQWGGKVELVYRKPSSVYAIFNIPSSLSDELDRIFSEIAAEATR